MINPKTLISILLFAGFAVGGMAQEQPLKDYAEDRRERKFCLYPSTLRMINIRQNESYNEMVSGIEKLLIYKLDSASRADKSYKQVLNTYGELGFEEYVSVYGGGTTMFVYGNENRKPFEFIGIFSEGDMAMAIYLRGMFNWSKIPELMKTFQGDEILDFLDLNSNNFENNSHDQ